jgi:MFS family permease
MSPQQTEKQPASAAGSSTSAPWYAGVTSYQWLILAVASAGWIFDAFEGQIFNITRGQMLHDILGGGGTPSAIQRYGDVFLAVFLAGGTFGGLLFGSLADKWGRRPTMVVTILMYSVFSGLTFFATNLWQVGILRFLVAMGVGGEWAVAASLVAEVFPKNARAHASGIFHATSVLGTWMATFAGLAVGMHWRYAYLVGIVPALLVLWVQYSVEEPESWKEAGAKAATHEGPKMGSFRDLLFHPIWGRRALLGMALAAVGLGSFWGIIVAGQDLTQELLLRNGMAKAEAVEHAKSAYGYIQTAGGFLGLLAFGPLCVRLGRKRTFAFMHIGAFLIVPIVCYLPKTYGQLLAVLPIFGFLTLGIHAGYAIYFPELFPNHLRATGTGFCFNAGRLVAASVLLLSGWLKGLPGMDLREAVTLLSLLFPIGLIIIFFLPETRGQPLPE